MLAGLSPISGIGQAMIGRRGARNAAITSPSVCLSRNEEMIPIIQEQLAR